MLGQQHLISDELLTKRNTRISVIRGRMSIKRNIHLTVDHKTSTFKVNCCNVDRKSQQERCLNWLLTKSGENAAIKEGNPSTETHSRRLVDESGPKAEIKGKKTSAEWSSRHSAGGSE